MVTGDDQLVTKKTAEHLALSFWKKRNEFEFVAPTATFEKSLSNALTSKKNPYIISDMGDNPTAGGAGDVTWTLRQILDHPDLNSFDGAELIYASIPGPELIEQANLVGIGGKVSAYVGAQIDHRYAPPIKLEGTLEALVHGDMHAETEAVIKVGSVKVIVTKKRKPYHYEKDFTRLGLDPRKSEILVVKIGYLVPELYDMRGDWIMALTPGGVDQNLDRLNYKRIKRPMYPLDKGMKDPDLRVRWISSM